MAKATTPKPPKPLDMWFIYHHSGLPFIDTARWTRASCVSDFMKETINQQQTWPARRKAGYRCIKCHVTPKS